MPTNQSTSYTNARDLCRKFLGMRGREKGIKTSKNGTDSNWLESVQNRAVHLIFSNYSYFSIMSATKPSLELPSLPCCWKICTLSLLDKIYDIPSLNQCLLSLPHYISSRLDHPDRIAWPPCSTRTHLHPFLAEATVDKLPFLQHCHQRRIVLWSPPLEHLNSEGTCSK